MPDLFLDRSLGGIQVPNALRTAGLRVRTLVDVFGSPADEDVQDPDWLRLAGERDWLVLMKDQRVRYRPVERAAVVEYKVRAFCLSGGNLKAAVMAEQFLAVMDDIVAACRRPGPLLCLITATGIREVDL